MDLCPAELEARYLALSRECHPDYHTGASPEAQSESIRRAAAVNDAYRALKDAWQRAELLVESAEPGTIERTKKLPQAFLIEAMELAERAEEATSDSQKSALRTELAAEISRYAKRIREALDAGRFEDAADRRSRCRDDAGSCRPRRGSPCARGRGRWGPSARAPRPWWPGPPRHDGRSRVSRGPAPPRSRRSSRRWRCRRN
jgi:Fe-S protein assembly co-chaperone HscB